MAGQDTITSTPYDYSTWLLHATNRVLQCRTVAALLETAYDAIHNGLGYDRIGLFLVDHERQVLVEHIGTDAEGARYYPVDRAAALIRGTYYGDLLADERMQPTGPGFIYRRDAYHEVPAEVRPRLDGRPDKTLLVALRTSERVQGLISVDNLTSGRCITADEAPPLVAYANALAAAVENVILLDERARQIDHLDADLARRVDQLSWLQDAATRLAIAHTLDDVLDMVYSSVREGLHYDRVGIMIMEHETGAPTMVREVRGTDEQGRPSRGYPFGDALDEPALADHSPDLAYLLQGHNVYYCADRWAITPPRYRVSLDGRMREQLVVALRHDQLLVGYISVDNLLSGRPIAESEAAPLVAFAAHAALAINRANLFDRHEAQGRRLARRVHDLEWLRDTARRVATAGSIADVLDVVIDGVCHGLGYDRVTFALVDPRTDACVSVVRADGDDTQTRFAPGHIGSAALDLVPGARALRQGADTYVTTNARAECPPEWRDVLDVAPVDTLMIALRVRDTFIGMFSVDNRDSGRPLTEADADPLAALANQIATAIANAFLRDTERAERERMELLVDMGHALSTTFDHSGILDLLTERLGASLQATSVECVEIDHAARAVRAVAWRGGARSSVGATAEWEPLQFYPEIVELVETQSCCRGAGADPPLTGSERDTFTTRRGEARLLVPIIVRDVVAWVLAVTWDDPSRITPEVDAVLTAIAGQAAVALEKVRLYQTEAELRRRAEVRARRLEHVHLLGESLKADLSEVEVGERIVAAVRTALGFQMAVLNLVDRVGDESAFCRVVATAGVPPDGVQVLRDRPYTMDDMMALFVESLRVSRSYFIPSESDTMSRQSAVPCWTPVLDNSGENAWRSGDELFVPLTDRHDGSLMGFISVDAPDSGLRPEREDIEVLEIFADQAVVALRNTYILADARHRAERDPVTGLYNHRAVHARVEVALAESKDNRQPLGVLAIDMDDFKFINDTHGHPVGDMALRHVAGLLQRCARASDVAARLGGDEFLLVLPGASPASSAEVARRLMELAQDAPLHIDGVGAVPVRLSVGVATYPDDAEQLHALLTMADTRLYEAKRSGGRGVETGTHARRVTADPGRFDKLDALVTAVDNKDRYTREHSEHVAELACRLADALGLSRDTQRILRVAGLLHDVGKIGVPDRILRKPGPLEPDEWEAMKEHASLSATLVRAVVADPDVIAAVTHHHERWDGQGYPARLKGAEIPLLGRIMIVADAVSAMAMDRPYRRGLSREVICAELRKGAGTQFDPALVERFIAAWSSPASDVA